MEWLITAGIYSILALILAWLALPMFVRRGHRGHGQTEAINNARQIGIALFEFEAEYGKFPDASTASEVKRRCVTPLTLTGNTSNDYFAQLIASGIAQSEPMFYAKAKGSVKPDGKMDSDATVLVHGNTSFAYIAGLDSKANPSTPVIFGPVIPGTSTLDTKVYDGKAVVLKLDCSATSVRIDAKGRIMIYGFDLLDSKNPIWNGKAPDVKWPK